MNITEAHEAAETAASMGGNLMRLGAHETIRDYLAAMARAGYRMDQDWQPTNTAPRDGRPVDLWCEAKGFTSGGPERIPDCWFSAGKWWRYDEQGDGQCRSEVFNITHWRPITRPRLAP